MSYLQKITKMAFKNQHTASIRQYVILLQQRVSCSGLLPLGLYVILSFAKSCSANDLSRSQILAAAPDPPRN